MGQIEYKKYKSEFVKEFSANFFFIKDLTDKRFGEISIFKNKKNKLIARRQHVCYSSQDYSDYVKQCRIRKPLENPNILQLYHAQETNQEQLCGDLNKITLYFEFYDHDLNKELIKRRDKNEHFTQAEIWFLLDSLEDACYFLQKNKIFHGDLRPINILLTQEGYVKIADHGILQIDESNFIKLLSNRQEKCFISPAQLKALKGNDLRVAHDYWKSDVYSLGMTILAAALLTNPLFCYDYKNCQILTKQLNDCLMQVKNIYSEFFVGVLKDMLLEDENARPSFEDLNQLLQPYKDRIKNFEEILPNQQQRQILQPIQIEQFPPNQQIPVVQNFQYQQNIQYTCIPARQQIVQIPQKNNYLEKSVCYGDQIQHKQNINQSSIFYQQENYNPYLMTNEQSSFNQHSQMYENQIPDNLNYEDDLNFNEIDRKVNLAIKTSEETIKKHGDSLSTNVSKTSFYKQNQMSHSPINKKQKKQYFIDQSPNNYYKDTHKSPIQNQDYSPIRYTCSYTPQMLMRNQYQYQ